MIREEGNAAGLGPVAAVGSSSFESIAYADYFFRPLRRHPRRVHQPPRRAHIWITVEWDQEVGAARQVHARVGHARAVAAEGWWWPVGDQRIGAVAEQPPAAGGAVAVLLVGVVVNRFEPFIPARDEVLCSWAALALVAEADGREAKRTDVIRAT